MDPIAILAIVSTAGKIIEYCASAAINLDRIKSRWKEAPAMLSSIANECNTVKQIIENIKNWLERHEEKLLTENETFLQALSSSLKHCLDTLQRLQDDAQRVSTWRQFKRSLNNDTLKECRDELRWHVQAATNLWSTFDRYVFGGSLEEFLY